MTTTGRATTAGTTEDDPGDSGRPPTTQTRRPLPRLGLDGLSVRTRITLAVALLTALALGATGLLVFLLGQQQVRTDLQESTAQEINELQTLQARGIDPRTNQAFTSIDRLVTVFLGRNVPARSELMVGAWDGRIQRSSVSRPEQLVEDPALQQAILDRVPEGGSTTVDSPFGDLYVEVLPLEDETGDGAFAVAQRVGQLREPLHRTMRTYALAAGLALAVVTATAA